MAVGIADAATRSVINGTDFGDNVLAALPDVIGQTIGGLVQDGIEGIHDAAVQRQVNAALAAPETDAEKQAIDDAIAADANSLQWGGTTISAADAHQMMLDRMRMDALAQSTLSRLDPAFQKLYADFQAGLTAADAYNPVSNQTILGTSIQRVTSGPYVNGLVTDDPVSGFQGYLYHVDNGNRYIFADAGTDLTQDADKKTDYALGGDQKVPQLDFARADAIQLAYFNHVPNLSFAGHSLGGALAILQGLTVNAPVVTFNSAPFSPTMARLYGVDESPSHADKLITNYRVANDPISEAEDNHVMITLMAKSLGLGPVTNRGWNLTPPPGNEVPLPVGAHWSGINPMPAHAIVNVLNIMAGRGGGG